MVSLFGICFFISGVVTPDTVLHSLYFHWRIKKANSELFPSHMWSEQTDPASLDGMVWPRAAAAAEVLVWRS